MSAFERIFGRAPEVSSRAPGRVNLIGEHTDYNEGFVLPIPIPQQATIDLAARTDGRVRMASLQVDGGERIESFELGCESRRGEWIDYVQGLTRSLQTQGWRLGGFEGCVRSEVPIGGGLSSSAAIAVALLRALRARFSLALDDVALALLVRRSENDFVGAAVGVMDPMASSVGRPGEALFIDTRDLSFRSLPLPRGVEVVVVDSGTRHRHAAGDYNRRAEECAEACRLLGVRSLRDLSPADAPRIAALPRPYAGRVRHVVGENGRVLEAVWALEAGRLPRLGELLEESHRSLRDDYEVSTPVVDRLVEILSRQRGILGARITGGGFGGAVVALARSGEGRAAAERAAAEYGSATGEHASVPVPLAPAEAASAP